MPGASFVTLNEKVLDDARLLELRFGGQILSPQQAVEESEREAAEKEREAETDRERMSLKAAPDKNRGLFLRVSGKKGNTDVQKSSK